MCAPLAIVTPQGALGKFDGASLAAPMGDVRPNKEWMRNWTLLRGGRDHCRESCASAAKGGASAGLQAPLLKSAVMRGRRLLQRGAAARKSGASAGASSASAATAATAAPVAQLVVAGAGFHGANGVYTLVAGEGNVGASFGERPLYRLGGGGTGSLVHSPREHGCELRHCVKVDSKVDGCGSPHTNGWSLACKTGDGHQQYLTHGCAERSPAKCKTWRVRRTHPLTPYPVPCFC